MRSSEASSSDSMNSPSSACTADTKVPSEGSQTLWGIPANVANRSSTLSTDWGANAASGDVVPVLPM